MAAEAVAGAGLKAGAETETGAAAEAATVETATESIAKAGQLHNTSKRKQNIEAQPKEKLPKTLLGFEYAVFAPTAVLILLQTGLAGIMVFLAPFSRWKDFGNPALYYIVSAIGTLISRFLFGRVADRRGSDVIVIPGMAVLVACLAVLPTVKSLNSLIALALPIGIAQGAVMPTLNSMLFKRCSPARRGTASGAYFAAIDLGFAIGAPLLGALADARDYSFMYWAAAVFVVLSLALYILISTDKMYNRKHNGII